MPTAQDWALFKTHCAAVYAQLRVRFLAYRAQAGQKSGITIRPERIAAWLSFGLVVVCTALAGYWSLRVARVVFPPQVSAKGVVFYEAASNLRVRTLFGEKEFDPSRLILRGVVITGTLNDVNQGMALIEVDGKPAETLELGDMMSPGIRLEKIATDGVVVRYQGRAYELKSNASNGVSY